MKEKQALKNVAAAFAANKEVNTFYANEYGHCFTEPSEGLTKHDRKDVADEIKAIESEHADATEASEEVAAESKKPTKKK
ncbi:hypothetical protein [Aurantibacillus circumpalustris]|uniref:hypothetical protein n=1 Tax=Aurantibacillus circumpalustris TaxID=3036359 RepID=UPI00295B1D85|nr:hypothetical protein [Aurantibacillus circumpalustris]